MNSIKGPDDSTEYEIFGEMNPDSTVKVTKNILPKGKKLVISIDGYDAGPDTYFYIKNQEDIELSYSIQKRESETSEGYLVMEDGAVLSVPAGTNEGHTDLQFKLYTGEREYAGKYEGTVTFTATVENQ